MKYRSLIAGFMMANGAIFGYIAGHQHYDIIPSVEIVQKYLTNTQDMKNRRLFSGNVGAVGGGICGIVVSILAIHAMEKINERIK